MNPEVVLWHTSIIGWTLIASFVICHLFYTLSVMIREKYGNTKIALIIPFMGVLKIIAMFFLVRQILGKVPYIGQIILVIFPMLIAMMFITLWVIYDYLKELEKRGEIKIIDYRNPKNE